MATRKSRPTMNTTQDAVQYSEVSKDIISGARPTIKLIESRDGQGKLSLQYDDPN